MEPRRIVFLDSWNPAPHEGSGTAVGISTLARGLGALGHRVEILRPQPAARRGPSAATGALLERTTYNLNLPARIRAHSPTDLVVGFDIDGWRWSRVRPVNSAYVVSLKGVAADEARFSRSLRERLLLATLARLERRNATLADRVLVPSAYSAEVVRHAYGIQPDALSVVPEPIEMSTWDALRRTAIAPPRRPTILTVARQYPRKDTATLLRAFVRVRRAIPEAHLRVVGGGPELPRLRALSRELAMEGAVTFHGAVPGDASVRRTYFEAHLFCLPSRQEGFGIVFLEAMAAGLPIVAARAGATPEVVPDGEVGVLVPAADTEALATALVDLLRDPGARARMGTAGVARARRFDLPEVASSFLEAVFPAPTARIP